jgi:hypothetical protein
VHQHIFDNNVRRFIKTELSQRGTQIISNDIDKDSLKLRIVAVGREITESKRVGAEHRMAQYGMSGYRLNIIQGTQSDSLLMLNNELSHLSTSREHDHQQLVHLTAENTSLTQQLAEYKRLELLSEEIRQEMSTLFPQVSHFSLSQVKEVSRDTTASCSYVAAIIQATDSRHLAQIDMHKLHDWLQTRVKADSLVVIHK